MAVISMTLSILLSRGILKICDSINSKKKAEERMQQEQDRILFKHKLELELADKNSTNRIKEIELKANYDSKLQEKSLMTTRETNLMIARLSSMLNLKNDFYRDAIRRFPLNISPLSLLENSGLSIDTIVGHSTGSIEGQSYKSPLNVLVLPVAIDSRVGGKEEITKQVWDAVYQDMESYFIQEYNPAFERPVRFYATAWNNNARPGLHASEDIYFFMKYLPTLVVEPRFDGKKLRIMLSGWSLGFDLGMRFVQEFDINQMDWMESITTAAYNRSKRCLDIVSKLSLKPDDLLSIKKKNWEHNVKMYKDLKSLTRNESSSELNCIGDYSRWFVLEDSDYKGISSLTSQSLALIVSALADVHNLIANEVEPHLPEVYKKYFPAVIEHAKRNNDDIGGAILKLYEGAYDRLVDMEKNNPKFQKNKLQLGRIYEDFGKQPPHRLTQARFIDLCKGKWHKYFNNEEDAKNFFIAHVKDFKDDDALMNELMDQFTEEQKERIGRYLMKK